MNKLRQRINELIADNARNRRLKTERLTGKVKGRLSIVGPEGKEVVGVDFNEIMPQHITSNIFIEEQWEPIDE